MWQRTPRRLCLGDWETSRPTALRRVIALTGVAGLMLAHGAGGGARHHALVALEEQLDLPVRRIEFAYRSEGRRFPDRAPKLIEQVCSEAEDFAAELATTSQSLVLGGRSLGGRMCSMAVASGLAAAGLVLLSYPLHPPARPDRLRVDHFGRISAPTLFVSGDNDAFGTPAEFEAELSALQGDVCMRWLTGEGHDPKESCDDAVVDAVRAFLEGL